MNNKIIIFSGKQYSGKDTLAALMLAQMPEFRRCAIGDMIKIEYGKQNGLTYDEIEQNKSRYRPGLIELGNWGRSQDADFWLKKIVEQEGCIMVTDVRVPHEYEIFKAAGAISIRVNCPRDIRAQRGGLVGEDDITEVGLDHIQDWDYVVDNDKDLETLQSTALSIVKELKK